jgi:small subunit ribosomal protein S18
VSDVAKKIGGKAKRSRSMEVNYKDLHTLGRLMTRQGRIFSRKRSGLNAQSQRGLQQAIKRARFMALLPYTGT